MNDDPRPLRDELHDLVSDVATSSGATARARDRAQRGIVRHRRNQRAAVAGLATVVLVAGVGAAFALGRDSRHSAPPAGETTTVAPAATTTVAPTATTQAPTPATITVAPWAQLPRAGHEATQRFPWGRGLDEVAYSVPQGEGASGGPAAFRMTPSADVELFDYSNSRILVHRGRGARSQQHLNLPSPAVTAAVFADGASTIAALPDALVVFGPDNRDSTFPYSGPEITRLAVYGNTVCSVGEDGSLRPVLHRIVPGTYVTGGTLTEAAAVTASISADRHTATIRVPSTGQSYELHSADPIGGVPAARRLSNGRIDVVLAPVTPHTNLDDEPLYALVEIPGRGPARLAASPASQGYLVNGPVWQIDETGIAVMTSNTTDGVEVAYVVSGDIWP